MFMKILSQRIHPLKGIKLILLMRATKTIHSEILNETEKPDENIVETVTDEIAKNIQSTNSKILAA